MTTTGGCHVWGGRSDLGGTGSETRLYLTTVIKTHKIIHKFAKRKNYSLWGPPQSSILGVCLPKTPTKRSAPGFRRGLPPHSLTLPSDLRSLKYSHSYCTSWGSWQPCSTTGNNAHSGHTETGAEVVVVAAPTQLLVLLLLAPQLSPRLRCRIEVVVFTYVRVYSPPLAVVVVCPR